MPHRLLALDTETTGLDFHRGERMIEVALIEIIDRQVTGEAFHTYINPRRKVDPEAFRVHGLSDQFLSDKPLFEDIADEMIDFIGGDDLVIHNAEFDLMFLNGELARCGRAPIESFVLDTLEMVKTVEPGKRASLDAMADRHNVDRSGRDLHGAAIDARMLAEVYISMTREQSGLDLSARALDIGLEGGMDFATLAGQLIVTEASDEESKAHDAYLESLAKETKGKCVWLAQALEAPKSSRALAP